MQGDPNSLADYTSKLGMEGIATINERRDMHGLDPVEDGDKLPHEMALEIATAAEEKKEAEGEEKEEKKEDKSTDKKESSDEA